MLSFQRHQRVHLAPHSLTRIAGGGPQVRWLRIEDNGPTRFPPGAAPEGKERGR
jgi:hypothetical protein